MVAVRARRDAAEVEAVLLMCLQLSMSAAFERDVCMAAGASDDPESALTILEFRVQV